MKAKSFPVVTVSQFTIVFYVIEIKRENILSLCSPLTLFQAFTQKLIN